MPFEDVFLKATMPFGGETFRGISRADHPDWLGWERVDSAKRQVGQRPRLLTIFQ
jgi:hypothetical protein